MIPPDDPNNPNDPAYRYGDIGHGLALFLFGLYLLYNEKSYLNDIKLGRMNPIIQGIFGGRYCILLMGFFAVYCGFIYNDCMSNPIFLFETTWSDEGFVEGDYRNRSGFWPSEESVYPFGIDPSW